MKKTVILIVILTLYALPGKALFTTPHADIFALSLTVRPTFELEYGLVNNNTIGIYGDFGRIRLPYEFAYPAASKNIGFEYKNYFTKNPYAGFNIGLGAKIGFITYPAIDQSLRDNVFEYRNSTAFIPSISCSYKRRFFTLFYVEPFSGVDVIFHYSDINLMFKEDNFNSLTFLVSFGVKIGLSYVL